MVYGLDDKINPVSEMTDYPEAICEAAEVFFLGDNDYKLTSEYEESILPVHQSETEKLAQNYFDKYFPGIKDALTKTIENRFEKSEPLGLYLGEKGGFDLSDLETMAAVCDVARKNGYNIRKFEVSPTISAKSPDIRKSNNQLLAAVAEIERY